MFAKPSVTVDILVTTTMGNAHKILLIKRKRSPFKDFWAIPGGYLDIDKKETVEQAAYRELCEETCLVNLPLTLFGVYSAVDRDPRGRVISVCYSSYITSIKDHKIQAKDDAKEYKWFSLKRLPELAFDHRTILEDFKKVWIG